jgi:hypothetical protein
MCLGPDIMLVASIIGGVASAGGAVMGAVAAKEQSKASKKSEALRRQQMRMEYLQKQRQAIRTAQLARATAATNIGGQTGTLGNSAFGGASSAFSASLGTQLGELGQANAIGEGMFDANAAYSEAQGQAATGAAIGQFGKDLFSSAPAIGRIGATLTGGGSGGWATTTEKA